MKKALSLSLILMCLLSVSPSLAFEPRSYDDKMVCKEIGKTFRNADRVFAFFEPDCFRELRFNDKTFEPLGPMCEQNKNLSRSSYSRKQMVSFFSGRSADQKGLLVIDTCKAPKTFKQNKDELDRFIKELGFKRVVVLDSNSKGNGNRIEIIEDN